MMAEFDGIEAGWGVYEIGRTHYETEEVHVIPHYDDLPHTFTSKCECEPEHRQERDIALPVYVQKVVYYNSRKFLKLNN